MRLTHPRGRWPSWWPNPGVRPVSTPLLPLLYRCHTMPSSSSSFRTSLLVYHLLSLSPNVCSGSMLVDNLNDWSKVYQHSSNLYFDTTHVQFLHGDTSRVTR